jgi:hypothetical protein
MAALLSNNQNTQPAAGPPRSSPRSSLERWTALLVRYWAYNMSLIHRQGGNWLGFGYTTEEKAQLQSLSDAVPGLEYAAWLALVVIIYLALLIVTVIAGMNVLIHAIGGDANMSETPVALFFLMLALGLVVSLSIGFPAAMLPAAALAGRWFNVHDADLPDRAATAHYFHKLWFQIARIAMLGVLALIPLWIFVPADSKIWVIGKLVLPLLSPAVAALTAAYYFTARLRRAPPAP